GTQRWLAGNAQGPLVDRGNFAVGHHTVTIESLPASIVGLFPHLEIAEDLPRSVASRFQAAADVLTSVEGLADVVGRLARVVHVMRAPRHHDISHSSPDLPFSIFVSLPLAFE